MSLLSKWTITLISGIILLICLVFLATIKPPRTTADPSQLKVMTYNVHQGFNNAGKIDPRLFLQTIRKVDPDIIGLQESDSSRLISANYDLVLWLSRKLNMYYYFGPKTKQQIYGVSLLSKYPLKDTQTTFLESKEDQRVSIEATITYQNTDIRLIVVHLGLSVIDRFNQTRFLLEEKVKKSTLPVILMGDFNTEAWEDFTSLQKAFDPNDPWYQHRITDFQKQMKQNQTEDVASKAKAAHFQGLPDFHEFLIDSWEWKNPDKIAFSWIDTKEGIGVPFEKLSPPVRIDYIWVPKTFDILDSAIVGEREAKLASDHLPLFSILRLK
ncbi:endonuclease/exonuclease/phosphatase family protein [Deltaproteobacteria bacterium TL4]